MRRMSKELDEALKNWDVYRIAELTLNGKEVKMPKPIAVCCTPTQYQIKVRIVA